MFATGYPSKVSWGASPLGRKSTRNSDSYQSLLKKKMSLAPMTHDNSSRDRQAA